MPHEQFYLTFFHPSLTFLHKYRVLRGDLSSYTDRNMSEREIPLSCSQNALMEEGELKATSKRFFESGGTQGPAMEPSG